MDADAPRPPTPDPRPSDDDGVLVPRPQSPAGPGPQSEPQSEPQPAAAAPAEPEPEPEPESKPQPAAPAAAGGACTMAWQWEGAGRWHSYGSGHTEQLVAAAKAGQPIVVLTIQGKDYTVDLAAMQQTKRSTGWVRAVRQHEPAPADTTTIEGLGDALQLIPLAPPATADCYPVQVKSLTPSALAEVRPQPATALLHQPDAAFKLCAAPDGRPLLLKVQRSTDVAEQIRALPFYAQTQQSLAVTAGNHHQADGSADGTADAARQQLLAVDAGIAALAAGAQAAALTLGIANGHYVPPMPARELVGDTVLSRLLDGKSPREALANSKGVGGGGGVQFCHSNGYSPTSPSYSPTNPSYSPTSPTYCPAHSATPAAAHKGSEVAAAARKKWLRDQSKTVHLAVPLLPAGLAADEDEADVADVATEHVEAGQAQPVAAQQGELHRGGLHVEACRGMTPGGPGSESRPFVNEQIRCIGGCLVLAPHSSYGSQSAAIVVDERKVLLGLATLCDAIADFHSSGVIHGDISPSNVLVIAGTGGGGKFVAIDPLRTPFGSVAPGGTLEWASPEQLVQQPVTASTDVFSVAMLAVALLKGLMFGRVAEHCVAIKEKPDSPPTLHTVKLIERPSLAFSGGSPAGKTVAVLCAALQMDAAARPTLAELRAALVAEAARPRDGGDVELSPVAEAAVATSWTGLRRGFGDGRLYRASASSGPRQGAAGGGEDGSAATATVDSDYFWLHQIKHK